LTDPSRERYGDTQPEISEITVSKVETYYLMNKYLSKLKNTPIKTLEDIVRYNDENRGSEGGHEGDLPAWAAGQRLFRQCVDTKGMKDETYYAALKHIQSQCREHGIDAALRDPTSQMMTDTTQETRHDSQSLLDALLFCDIKAGGTQIAAQAGYPIITIPIGLDPDGMPVPLTLQHGAWQEAKLVKWASAIEDLLRHGNTRQTSHDPSAQRMGRVPPTYKNHLRKNIPVDPDYDIHGSD
jgi:amidase